MDDISTQDKTQYFITIGEHPPTRVGPQIRQGDYVLKDFQDSSSLKEVLAKFIALYNSYEEKNYGTSKKEMLDFLKKAFINVGLPFEMINDEDGVFVFPQGALELDDALVFDPLIWLNKYPDTKKCYMSALEEYSRGGYARNVADNLRKALERLLQEVLNNTKNLKNNIDEISLYLKKKKIDSNVRLIVRDLISSYDKLNKETAKHHDKVDANMLEYYLYQTGLIMRMIIKNSNASPMDDLPF